VMWFSGRYASTFKSLNVLEMAKSIALLTVASSMAFVISNGSFYLFSGKFDAMSFINFVTATEQFYFAYVGAALIYGVLGLFAFKLSRLLPVSLVDHKSI